MPLRRPCVPDGRLAAAVMFSDESVFLAAKLILSSRTDSLRALGLGNCLVAVAASLCF
jgi:hypothetical protein